ncbi:MAG: class F sortase [Candidatus Nomurabacteria bacterium]|jgi:LPXTG-site transpeptidase (sortase) family protein|nr:class F sortase [Candidatus Nomurabacteria bacterium]
MSLKINNFVSKIPKILLWLCVIFVTGCIVKVFVWEQMYYASKDGTARATAAPAEVEYEEQEVSEEDVTQEQVKQHVVAPDRPRYLTIEKLGVQNARIIEVGIAKDGKMGVPTGIFDVGWYNNSSKPGGNGTLLMDGHNGGPTRAGVFKKLDTLKSGDKIIVERGDGIKFTYEVVENKTMSVEEANSYMGTMQKTPVAGKESLSLITCTGEWTNVRRTYLSRAMVRAVLVEN